MNCFASLCTSVLTAMRRCCCIDVRCRQQCSRRVGLCIVIIMLTITLLLPVHNVTWPRRPVLIEDASSVQAIREKCALAVAQTNVTVDSVTQMVCTTPITNKVCTQDTHLTITAVAESDVLTNTYTSRFEAIRGICESDDARVVSARKYSRGKASPPMLELTNPAMRYCPIAKTGSTLWKRVMLYLRRANGSLGQNELPGQVCEPDAERETLHRCADKLLRVGNVSHEHNATIVIVRDPWHRLVSGYLDKMVHQKSDYTIDCYKYNNLSPAKANVSFSQFVDCVLNGKADNWHFSPQFNLCDFCGEAATASHRGSRLAIVHSEEVPETFTPLLRYAGYTDACIPLYEEAYRNASRSSRSSSERRSYMDMYAQLSNDKLKRLEAMYRLDAEAFGYNLTIPRAVAGSIVHPPL